MYGLVINPATRGDASALVAMLRQRAGDNVELAVRETTSPGHGVALARELAEVAEVVIAVGGDGTVADVATGLSGTTAALGIIPAGSTNITAQELGLPLFPRHAAGVIFGPHQIRAIDVGTCGDHRFLHMAGAGLDSHFFQRTSRALKRRVGWLAYLPAATIALRQPPSNFVVTVDQQSLSVLSPLVIVANGSSVITPLMRIYPDIRTDDGWLDVLVFTAVTADAVAQTVGSFMTGSLGKSPHVVRMRGKSVAIEAEPRLPVQLDGDVVTVTPSTFGIDAAALRVVVPEHSAVRSGGWGVLPSRLGEHEVQRACLAD